MAPSKLVILGGYGTFGSLIAEQLAQADTELIIAGRDANKGAPFADSLGARFVRCDATDPQSLRTTIADSRLVINASGPFQALDYSIPIACIDRGCHYVDLGDGRAYVAGIERLHDRARMQGVFACVGASTTPAVTSAAVEELRTHLRKIRSIEIFLTAGNKVQAGASTIASILAYVGSPVRIWQGGQWRDETGWGMGQFVDFPRPVGRRRVQLCDVPDLELFPKLFDAESVRFRAGVELTLFNYGLAVMAQWKRLRPTLKLPSFARPLVSLSKLFKSLGTFHGSVAVSVTGDDGQEHSLAFVAPRNGPRVPASPAVLLARKILAEDIPDRGAFACLGFIGLQEFTDHLAQFGIQLVRGENGTWLS